MYEIRYMTNKCEWKDGKFYPCDGFEPTSSHSDKSIYCIYCDTDVKKPEPEEKPLIVKSGQTWVANYKGVDYLMLDPEYHKSGIFFKSIGIVDSEIWKPFSEITLTDEIAKLRPMVYVNRLPMEKLWGIDGKECLTENKTFDLSWTRRISVRLATPHELKELS